MSNTPHALTEQPFVSSWHRFEPCESSREKDKFVSIMSYEDAIISAIIDLKDNFSLGSSVTAIAKHIKANFVDANHPQLRDKIEFFPPFNVRSSLFLQALKSLVEKGYVDTSTSTNRNRNGSMLYSLSSKYKKERAERINRRLKLLETCKERARQKSTALSKHRKDPPARKSLIVKAHLVDSKAIAVVPDRKHSMDLDLSPPRRISSTVPVQVNVRKELKALKKKKCIRGNIKITPHKTVARKTKGKDDMDM